MVTMFQECHSRQHRDQRQDQLLPTFGISSLAPFLPPLPSTAAPPSALLSAPARCSSEGEVTDRTDMDKNNHPEVSAQAESPKIHETTAKRLSDAFKKDGTHPS